MLGTYFDTSFTVQFYQVFQYGVPVAHAQLAKRPRPLLHGTTMQWKNHCHKFFVSLVQVNLCHRQDSLDQDQIPSLLCLIKICQYKRACIVHLILVDILFILILSIKKREGGFFFLLNRQNLLSMTKVIYRRFLMRNLS